MHPREPALAMNGKRANWTKPLEARMIFAHNWSLHFRLGPFRGQIWVPHKKLHNLDQKSSKSEPVRPISWQFSVPGMFFLGGTTRTPTAVSHKRRSQGRANPQETTKTGQKANMAPAEDKNRKRKKRWFYHGQN